MPSVVIRRVVLCSLVATLAFVVRPAAQSAAPTYSLAATVPLGLQGYSDLDVDPGAGRVYLAIRDGLRVLDSRTGNITPEMTELETSGAIRVAPDIRRLFAEIDDDYIGFVNLDSYHLDHLVQVPFPGTLMYEPATEELFVFSERRPEVLVFDGRSGERKASIALPGWGGVALLRTPGRIYVNVPPKQGLYVIETADRQVTAFPLPKVVDNQPSRFEVAADPSGRALFVSDDYEIVAVDTASGRQLGSVRTRGGAYLMYDDTANVLLARVSELDWPQTKQVAYRFDGAEFHRIGAQNLPTEGGIRPYPTGAGFVSGYVAAIADINENGLPVAQKKYVTVWTRGGVRP